MRALTLFFSILATGALAYNPGAPTGGNGTPGPPSDSVAALWQAISNRVVKPTNTWSVGSTLGSVNTGGTSYAFSPGSATNGVNNVLTTAGATNGVSLVTNTLTVTFSTNAASGGTITNATGSGLLYLGVSGATVTGGLSSAVATGGQWNASVAGASNLALSAWATASNAASGVIAVGAVASNAHDLAAGSSASLSNQIGLAVMSTGGIWQASAGQQVQFLAGTNGDTTGGSLILAAPGTATAGGDVTLRAGSGFDIPGNLFLETGTNAAGVPGSVYVLGWVYADGFGITNLNAGHLSAGTVPLARLGGITSNQIAAATDAAYRSGGGAGSQSPATNNWDLAGYTLTNSFAVAWTNCSIRPDAGGTNIATIIGTNSFRLPIP